MNQKKILIVEDNKFLCEMFKIAFSKNGFQTEISFEGKSGLEKLSKFKPDIVLLDIMMPGEKNGFDVLKSIRESFLGDIPVVINSNLSQDKDVARAISLGATKYIKKCNQTPQEIVEEIEKILSTK